MSIEQKIAQILAESKAAENANPDNAKNNVQDQKEAEGGTSKKPNRATQGAAAPEASHITGMEEDFSQFTFEQIEDFMMSEDFEQLDELSKDTLVSYMEEAAKWRQGYSASGHPAGFKHKSSEVGPVGGTFTNEPHGYGSETKKVPVNKYRDSADELAGRADTKTSTQGKPLLKRNAERNLKQSIQQSRGKHGPVGKLPEHMEMEEDFVSMKEDIDALMNGEELSEEFKQKATTIYEAAVMNRVKQEIAKLEEEFDDKLAEQVESIKEGLVEQVDGYLDYVVEQWIAQNEIALEHGMKSEILEGFVTGLKGLFEEHYIDIPEEKFDVLASMEEQIEQLSAKLDETVESNIEMKKTLSEMKRVEIVAEACEGLTDTEVEKLTGLAEELSYENSESFKTKVQTIRENYFNIKAQAEVNSVVTDSPVDTLVEEKKLNPTMNAYLSVLNRK